MVLEDYYLRDTDLSSESNKFSYLKLIKNACQNFFLLHCVNQFKTARNASLCYLFACSPL